MDFFPLGVGISSNNSAIEEAVIMEGGIMVMGHAFGTVSYVNDKCTNGRKTASRAIQNLADLIL